MRFSIHNLGCRVNLAELEKITDDLIQCGYTLVDANDSSAEHIPVDIAIVNTCTVTAQADKKSWRRIRQLAEGQAVEFLFITGCYSELEPTLGEKLKAYAVKSTIVAQRDKPKLAGIIDDLVRGAYGYTYAKHSGEYKTKFEAFKQSRGYAGSLMSSQERFYGHRRALLKVQDGCNVFCSYCRIPYARGAPHSRSLANILEQITALARQGVAEITLTGINLTAYRDKDTGEKLRHDLLQDHEAKRSPGTKESHETKRNHETKRDQETNFSEMLESVLDHAANLGGISVRLSSLEPHGLDEKFFALLKHSALTPHLHLPLQSSCDRILTLMRRPYTLGAYKEMIDRIYAEDPHFSISTDVITGYPSESEEEFLAGLEFIRSCEFLRLHVFPFSYRPLSGLDNAEGHAKLMHEAVPDIEKKRRARILRDLSEELEEAKLSTYRGRSQRFVLETELPSDEFIAADLPLANTKTGEGLSPGGHTNVRVFTGTSEYYLKGRLVVPDDGSHRLGEAVSVTISNEKPLMFSLAKSS